MPMPKNTTVKTELKSTAQTQRPRLRCPACGAEVELPSSHCPKCEVDLRTGIRPPKKSIIPYLPQVTMFVKIGLVVLVCSLLWPYAIKEKQSYEGASLGQTIKILAQDHPIIMKPYVIVNEAVESIKEVNRKLSTRHEHIDKWLHSLDGTSPAENTQPLRELTPAQRYKTLQELDSIISGQSGTTPSDLVYLQKMTPAQRDLLLKRMTGDL